MDILLSDREVAQITGRARSTLQKDRLTGAGLPFIRFGRQIRYRQSDVVAYLDALPTHYSTSELVGALQVGAFDKQARKDPAVPISPEPVTVEFHFGSSEDQLCDGSEKGEC